MREIREGTVFRTCKNIYSSELKGTFKSLYIRDNHGGHKHEYLEHEYLA